MNEKEKNILWVSQMITIIYVTILLLGWSFPVVLINGDSNRYIWSPRLLAVILTFANMLLQANKEAVFGGTKFSKVFWCRELYELLPIMAAGILILLVKFKLFLGYCGILTLFIVIKIFIRRKKGIDNGRFDKAINYLLIIWLLLSVAIAFMGLPLANKSNVAGIP